MCLGSAKTRYVVLLRVAYTICSGVALVWVLAASRDLARNFHKKDHSVATLRVLYADRVH